MNRDELKAGCGLDLSFPYHHRETPGERLRAVADYMEQAGFETEHYLGGASTGALEEKVAERLGYEDAIWCPTGTMAQGIAARLHAERTGRQTLLLHPSSHLELHEEHGYKHAHGMNAELTPDWSRVVAAEDLQEGLAAAFVELPQRHNGGLLPAWQDLEALKRRAAQLQVPLHMDGARLWSVRPFYDDRPYADITAGFASTYVSLYKDIGALGGAVLAGDKDFVAEARTWRARLGGLLVSPWPMVPDALRLIDRRPDELPACVGYARSLGEACAGLDGVKVEPAPPQVNMLHFRLGCDAETALAARDEAARQTGVWLSNRPWTFEGDHVSSFEIVIGERALGCDVGRIAEAVSVMGRHAASV